MAYLFRYEHDSIQAIRAAAKAEAAAKPEKQATPPRWTKERDDRLRELWPTRLRASKIAVIIGAPSRDSVISRAWRLNLPPRAASTRRIIWTTSMRADFRRMWDAEEPSDVIASEFGVSPDLILRVAKIFKFPPRKPGFRGVGRLRRSKYG